jgi:integrase
LIGRSCEPAPVASGSRADEPVELAPKRVNLPCIASIGSRSGNLKLAQLLAGHASIQTTADIYAHLDIADLRDALRIVAERRAERRRQDAE